MKFLRAVRRFQFVLLAMFFASTLSQAQSFPSKPIRIFVGYGAGGASDMVARVYAEKLQSLLGQPVIVENKAGAFEQLAARAVLGSPADGYSLWLGTAGALTMGPGIRTDIPYSVLKNFTHVARVAEVEAVFCVKNSLPVNTLGEFVAYAKAHPNQLFYATAGMGAGNHLMTEYLMSATGIKMTHVPYKSDADVARELAAGAVDFGMPVSPQAVPFVNDRKFKAIAVTGSARLKSLPDVPAASESVEALKTLGVYSIYGVLAPSGLPEPVLKTLSEAFNKAAQMPDVIAKLDAANLKATTSTPAELTHYLEAETAKWNQLGKTAKITFN